MQLGVVDEDEAVVEVVGVRNRQARILAVELGNFGRRRLTAILADEVNGYAWLLLRQYVKGHRVRIRVDDDDLRLRRLHKPRDIPKRIVLGTGGKNAVRKKVAAIKVIKAVSIRLSVSSCFNSIAPTR